MKTISLKASSREVNGSKSAKAVRKEGLVPGVIYGGKDTVHFAIPANELNSIVYTGDFFKVAIDVDGTTYTTIPKDMQFNPITDDLIHIDFQELVEGRKVKTSIPIRLMGRSKGVVEGGVLQHKLLRLNVRIKPEDMIEELSLDVSDLELGQSIKVKDIEVGDIEVLDSVNIPVASVITPRALRSAQSKGAADATAEEATEEATE